MGDTMKPTEREELIQRYYDGETVGRESELAERMLQEDPVAQEILEGLVRLSGSIQLELDSAVEAEDFSGYWQQIEERLPDGPLSEEVATLAVPAAADVVVGRPQRMGRPRRSWLPWLLGPSLGAAAAAMLMVLLQPAELRVDESPLAVVPAAPADHTIDIESIESDGPLVMVMQENSEEPAIIWFVESDAETEG
ncbi:MAG: hypothetical protein CMP23_13470 [Rickettsiales bacterium]|nr:hypothetical protein [Rickettsiales bacterium]